MTIDETGFLMKALEEVKERDWIIKCNTIDQVLEIIDQMDAENEECNDDPAKTLLKIEHQDFRERVLALKGGEQE